VCSEFEVYRERKGEWAKMNEPMELEEYIRASRRFTDAAHKFKNDNIQVNYYKLSESCRLHQGVSTKACAFARKVIETRGPDLAVRSQLSNYIEVKGQFLGVIKAEHMELPSLLGNEPTSDHLRVIEEIAPTGDLYVLRQLQAKPELVRKCEQTPDLEICLDKLASTLEQWNALYRELYSVVKYGHP
jgi:hypothetical protein